MTQWGAERGGREIIGVANLEDFLAQRVELLRVKLRATCMEVGRKLISKVNGFRSFGAKTLRSCEGYSRRLSYSPIMVRIANETTTSAKRRKAGLADIENLLERATAVLDKARQSALRPDSSKVLRRFTLREVTDLLGIHPSVFYEMKDVGDLPTGEKSGTKRLFTLEEIHRLQEHLQLLPRQRFNIDRAVVVTVANFKGGVAKTFTAVNFAQYLALRGYRTLVIDLDPQGSMSTTFGLNPARDVDDRQTVLPYFYGERQLKGTDDGWTGTLRSAIQNTYWHGLDLVAANLHLYSGEFALGLRRDTDPDFQFHRPLVDAIDTVRGDYDVVVVDTPPSLSFSTTTAIYAAEGLVIPVPAAMIDMESCRAFFELLYEVLSAVQSRYKEEKEYEFLKVLISKYQTDVPSQQRLAVWIRSIFEDWCLVEPMVSSKVVENLGPKLLTLYEARSEQDVPRKGDESTRSKRPPRISRAALKRVLESANAVHAVLEADLIDVFRTRQAEQASSSKSPSTAAA